MSVPNLRFALSALGFEGPGLGLGVGVRFMGGFGGFRVVLRAIGAMSQYDGGLTVSFCKYLRYS